MPGRRLAANGVVALLTLVLVVGSDAAASAQSKETPKLTKTCWEISNDRDSDRRLGLVSVQHADRLVLYRQQYDTAEELYRAVLARDPGDRCAIRGLARIGQERAKDEAEAADNPLKRSGKAWDDFYADWLAPATDLAVPALALLLVLLVLSRLATRLVVPMNTREWPRWLRRVSWWGGFVMLGLAASLPFALSYLAPDLHDRAAFAGFVAAATLAAIGLTCCALLRGWLVVLGEVLLAAALGWATVAVRARDARAADDLSWAAALTGALVVVTIVVFGVLVLLQLTSRLRRDAWTSEVVQDGILHLLVAAVAAVIAISLATTWLPDSGSLERGWPWPGWHWRVWLLGLGVALAVAGSVLIGFGRGLRLRLQVDARNATGSEDAGAARYVAARLQEFGSERPRGIEIPQQTDVTTLPDDALTTLPEGRVIAALFKVFRALRPTVPWRATVTLTQHGSATVTLTRNDHVVEMTRISRSALKLTAVPDGGGDGQAQLLTASAALILFALAERHPRLEPGLCGATRWQSGALHVLGVEAPSTEDGEGKQRLLAAAVAFDHGNALARVAYLHCFGRRGDADGQLRFASLMGALYKEIFGTGGSRKGFEALEVRMLYSLAASNLNAELLLRDGRNGDTRTAERAWHDARGRTEALISKLADDHPDDERLQEFVVEARPSAYYLWRSVDDRARFWLHDRELAEWTRVRGRLDERIEDWNPDSRPDWPTRLSSGVHYDRACWNAERHHVDDGDRRQALEQAIDDLREAATDEGLRDWAPQDPSLRIFRDPDTAYELRQRYKEIVGGAGDAPRPAPARGAVRRPAMARRRRAR